MLIVWLLVHTNFFSFELISFVLVETMSYQLRLSHRRSVSFLVFWIMTSLEEKISILKMQILSSQVQSTLLRSSSFKLQINLNVLSLDMKYVTNIFEKNANFPVWAVFHKTYVIRWFERKNLSLWMGSGKVTRCCYISIDYFWHLGTYSSKLAIFYKSIGITEQRKREAKLGAVKFESLKFSLITFIF